MTTTASSATKLTPAQVLEVNVGAKTHLLPTNQTGWPIRVFYFVANYYIAYLWNGDKFHLSETELSKTLEGDPVLSEAIDVAIHDSRFDLLFTHPNLVSHIQNAARHLHNSTVKQQDNQIPKHTDAERDATERAWKTKFRGQNADLLVTCLQEMNAKRKKENAYQNFTSIVQSSGMGKSRTVDEASKQIFTLPFNLRDLNENAYYPPPDNSVRKHLLQDAVGQIGVGKYGDLRSKYFLFFKHLFHLVRENVNKMKGRFGSIQTLAARWRELMLDANQELRSSTYEGAIRLALDEEIKNHLPEDGEMKDALIEAAQTKLKELLVAITQKCRIKPKENDLQLLIYFDEAHCLQLHNTLYETNVLRVQRTAYMALCSVINEFRSFDMMTLFLSTSSSLARFAPPLAMFWSSRGLEKDVDLQAPFVELPFMLNLKAVKGGSEATFDFSVEFVEGGQNTTLNSFCSLETMAKQSRPLFSTRFQFRKQGLVEFAKAKLQGGLKQNDDGLFAAIAVRVLAEIEPQRLFARDLEAELVAGHMRVVYSVPAHREFMKSGFPSEPLLAEAAAQLMQDHAPNVLRVFRECLKNGLIGRGDRGELISRHFLTSGFDKTRHWEGGDEIFSKPVRLLDYLKCLFGESNYEKNIKNCKPDNVVDGEDLETAFKDAYVYFTHFVRAKDGSVVTDRCALAALCRGMAFQCCPNQVSIDIVISVVFKKSLDEPLRPTDITFFAVQVKNKIDQSVVFVDLEKLPAGEGVKVFSDSNSKIPYIVLVMELGSKKSGITCRSSPKLSSPRPQTNEQRGKHPRYFITAHGCSEKTYGVVDPEDAKLIAGLLDSEDVISEHPRDGIFGEAVRALMPFWTEDMCGYLQPPQAQAQAQAGDVDMGEVEP